MVEQLVLWKPRLLISQGVCSFGGGFSAARHTAEEGDGHVGRTPRGACETAGDFGLVRYPDGLRGLFLTGCG